MSRKSRDILVTEIPGNQYQTLQDAQLASLHTTAGELSAITCALLASGRLIRRGNQIVVNQER